MHQNNSQQSESFGKILKQLSPTATKRQSIWPARDTLRPPAQVGVSSWQSIPRSVKFNPIFIPRIMSSSTGLAVVVVSSATTTATFKVNLDHNTAPQQRRQSGQRSGRHIFSVCAFEKPTLVWNPFFLLLLLVSLFREV